MRSKKLLEKIYHLSFLQSSVALLEKYAKNKYSSNSGNSRTKSVAVIFVMVRLLNQKSNKNLLGPQFLEIQNCSVFSYSFLILVNLFVFYSSKNSWQNFQGQGYRWPSFAFGRLVPSLLLSFFFVLSSSALPLSHGFSRLWESIFTSKRVCSSVRYAFTFAA